MQTWHSSLQESHKGTNYNIIKQDIALEKYLITTPKCYWLSLLKFRTENHRFPVETGRWDDTDYAERKCTLCNQNDVGDNFHYLLICLYFRTDRKRYLNSRYYTRPNILLYQELLAILRKTIEGYGFCFDFIVKGIIFSTQIINRYVAEPSLCKESIKFSHCLEALLADLQKR